MSASDITNKLWNYCNVPGLGQSLARSPGREYAGTRFFPGSPTATTRFKQ
jgi:hypothetical protein